MSPTSYQAAPPRDRQKRDVRLRPAAELVNRGRQYLFTAHFITPKGTQHASEVQEPQVGELLERLLGCLALRTAKLLAAARWWIWRHARLGRGIALPNI